MTSQQRHIERLEYLERARAAQREQAVRMRALREYNDKLKGGK